MLDFINDKIRRRSVAPSFTEMMDKFGFASPSQVYALLNALQEKGYIYREPHKHNAIKIVKMPTNEVPASFSILETEAYRRGFRDGRKSAFDEIKRGRPA